MDSFSFFDITHLLHPYLLWTPQQGLIIYILLFVALLMLSFTLAGSEVALFSLSSRDLNMLKTKQHSGAKRILAFMEEPRIVFTSILIANIFVNITLIVLSNHILNNIFDFSKFHYLFAILAKVFIIAFILIFFVQMLPKIWGLQNNLRFAYTTSGIVEMVNLLLHGISKWVVSISETIGNNDLIAQAQNDDEQMNAAIDKSVGIHGSSEEKNIMKGVVKFGGTTVRQVMRSRLEISGVRQSATFDEVLKQIKELNYSRLPVFKGSMDDVVGVLYVKDLTAHINEGDSFDWHSVLRQPFFVPESKLIADLLKEFQQRKVHFAIVVDEFGGTSGLITLEDIMEEVIGDIHDEFDTEESLDKQLDDNTFIFEGKTMIRDACRIMKIPVSTFDRVRGESESIGGLVLELAGQFPSVNDVINTGDFDFTVLEADKNRIVLVKVAIQQK